MLSALVTAICSIIRFIGATLSNRVLHFLIFIALAISMLLIGISIYTIFGTMSIALLALLIVSLLFPPARYITGLLIFGLIVIYIISVIYLPLNDYLIKTYPSISAFKNASRKITNVTISDGAISLEKKADRSETITGTLGKITRDSVAYDEGGNKIIGIHLKKEQSVKHGGKNKPQDPTGNEGLISVVLPNENGDFINGKSIWIPIRNVEWDSEKAPDSKEDSPPPKKEGLAGKLTDRPEAKKPPGPIFITSVPQGKTVALSCPDQNHFYLVLSFSRSGTNLEMKMTDEMSFEAASEDGKRYSGSWTQGKKKGAVSLDYSGDHTATGNLVAKSYNCSITM